MPAHLEEASQVLLRNSPLPPQLEGAQGLGADPAADGLLVDPETVGDLGDREQRAGCFIGRWGLGHGNHSCELGAEFSGFPRCLGD